MKRCSNCLKEKDDSKFLKSDNTQDGLSKYCKTCISLKQKEYKDETQEITKILSGSRNEKRKVKNRKLKARENWKKSRIVNYERKKKWRIENRDVVNKLSCELREKEKARSQPEYKNYLNKLKENMKFGNFKNVIKDEDIITKAFELRNEGLFVSDISKILTTKTGKKITQMELWGFAPKLHFAPKVPILHLKSVILGTLGAKPKRNLNLKYLLTLIILPEKK